MKKKSRADQELPAALAIDNNNILKYEILPRLPAKSICRFMCVSKQWNSFLSTRMFANMQLLQHHINNPKKTYKLLLIDKPAVDKDSCCKSLNHGSVTVGFNILKEACPIFDLLLASLDGLVCVASTKTVINSLALWNPLTDAYYKLPSNPNFTRPYDSIHDVIGFYSDSSNDYKLLYWATFCDHSLYFSIIKPSTDDQCIICFDVNTEEFRGSMWKLNSDDGTWEEVAFFSRSPYSVFGKQSRLHRKVCMTRNARDDWFAILEGGPRDSPNFEIMNMEEFTLTNPSWPEYTYS
uniref:F-box/kelch-repeat protein At3g23880-like n=1 Tax=Erigeron canadensis TaxID=72917 RepID=UPI001CB98007|nr:F-box/kelch-repeat protein At3g23880-like [Erigeron canadensis]